MKFKNILKCITGISTPIFGLSWNPEDTERDLAKRVINFLEDRRVLYKASENEVPYRCVESVSDIRKFLTSIIDELPDNVELVKSLKAMRAACRKFQDRTEVEDIIKFGVNRNHWASWEFNSSLGELRGVFGIHVAKIAVTYGIDIEKDLATIIPIEDKE